MWLVSSFLFLLSLNILTVIQRTTAWKICVYYVQTSKNPETKNGSTYFLKPYQPQRPLDFGSDYLTSEQMTITAEEGKLLVFPGYLYHGSHPLKNDNDRIIISVNSLTELKK